MTSTTGRTWRRAGVSGGAWRAGMAAAAALIALAAAGPATAQIVPTPNPGRDCQTIRTCNFARGAAVRGCLSSYSCKVCRTVRARCSIGRRNEVCVRIVCDWR
jgi:hypothetical protein